MIALPIFTSNASNSKIQVLGEVGILFNNLID
jgi:hypothetical protein